MYLGISENADIFMLRAGACKKVKSAHQHQISHHTWQLPQSHMMQRGKEKRQSNRCIPVQVMHICQAVLHVASGELTVSHLGNTQQVHSCRHVVQTNSICAHNHIISSLPTSQQIYVLPSPERLRASADNNALLNHNMHLL